MLAIWNTACLDWQDRLNSGRSLVPPLPLFDDEGEKALRIFKRLRVPDIEGFPTHGEVCGEWVFDLVRTVFGCYDPELKRRMIQEFFLLIPKGNGKTSVSAAIIVTAIIMNRRPEAEFLLIAPTKKIADNAYKQASGIIRLDKQLVKIFHSTYHNRKITHRVTLATIEIKAADTDAITGSKSAGILIDETHEFATKPRADDVFLEIRGGLGKRPEGFLIQITTQSKSPPAGIFKSELVRARDVRDGKVVLPVLAILYEHPERVQAAGIWKQEKYWGLVNPNLGKSVQADFLRTELTKAERDGEAALALYASQYHNIEIGLGLHTNAWEGSRFWLGCADKTLTLKELLRRCEVVVAGIDGGGMDDLLGLAVLGREIGTRKWLLWTRAWCHECVLELRKEIAPRLLDFKKDGDLWIIADGSDEDVVAVADIIQEIDEAGLFPDKHGVAVDQAGITEIVDELERRDFSADPETGLIIGVRQGWELQNSIKSMARRCASKTLVHSGSAMMSWCVSNAKTVPVGNAITITKQAAGTAKIDPLIASFTGVALMSKNPAAARSVYEDEDIMV